MFHVLPASVDVCMKEPMCAADSVDNLRIVREFCDSCLKSCCHVAVEDLLYTPQELKVATFTLWISDPTNTALCNVSFAFFSSTC